MAIQYCLSAYCIHRFEFDEDHPFVQTWINFDILPDATSSDTAKSTAHKQRSPILIPSSLTTAPETELTECPSDLEIETEDVSLSMSSIPDTLPPLLSPTVSTSLSAASISSSLSAAVPCDESNGHRLHPQCHANWECTASLPTVKWSTIFLGTPLDAALHHQVYVANVSIDKLGYGVGIVLCGHRKYELDDEAVFGSVPALTRSIQRRHDGYPDAMSNCFVVYDDGTYYDWNGVSGQNVNALPAVSRTVQVISKLSKHQLRATKPDDSRLTPNPVLSPDAKSLNEGMSDNLRGASSPRKSFYRGPKRRKSSKKKKRISEKFGFDEKRDILQIAVDMVHRKVTIHNLQSHRCVVVRDFHYDSLRIGFALRKSKVTVIDQKWV